jgi:SAM-dependent methyltransferase
LEYLKGIVKNTDKVLSCGAGYGNVIEKLDCEQYAIDLSWNMLKNCGIKNKQEANFDEIPYPDKYFDIVFGICAFQHSKNPEKTLKEWERVAKRVIIIDGDKDSSIGLERERRIKDGTWEVVGDAKWLSRKDFNYKVTNLLTHIICLDQQ